MPKFNRYAFEVVGRTRFPVDMLRYDACWPADAESAGAIEASLDPTQRGERPPVGWRVKLTSSGETPPTEARWASFMWRVDPTTVRGHRA